MALYCVTVTSVTVSEFFCMVIFIFSLPFHPSGEVPDPRVRGEEARGPAHLPPVALGHALHPPRRQAPRFLKVVQTEIKVATGYSDNRLL